VNVEHQLRLAPLPPQVEVARDRHRLVPPRRAAPGAVEDDGVYVFLGRESDGTEQLERQRQAAAPLGEALADFAKSPFTRVTDYPSRWSTPTLATHAREQLKLPSISMEIPYHKIAERVLTRDDYREMGRRLARALATL
jgi:hypothetical protein